MRPEQETEIGQVQAALNNTTRLSILSLLHKESKTVAMLADEIGMSRPVIWRHVEMLLRHGLVKECQRLSEKRYRQEVYYENNFPVITRSEAEQILPVLDTVGREVETVVRREAARLEKAWSKTSAASKGFTFVDVSAMIAGHLSAGPCYRALRSAGIYKQPVQYLWKVSGIERGALQPAKPSPGGETRRSASWSDRRSG